MKKNADRSYAIKDAFIPKKEKVPEYEKDIPFASAAIEYLKVKKRGIIVIGAIAAAVGVGLFFGISNVAENSTKNSLESNLTDSFNRYYAGDTDAKTISNFNINGVNIKKDENIVAFYGTVDLEGNEFTKYAMAEYTISTQSMERLEKTLGTNSTQDSLKAFAKIVADGVVSNAMVNYGCEIDAMQSVAEKVQNEDKNTYAINDKLLQVSANEFANAEGSFKMSADIFYVGAPSYDSETNKVTFEVMSNVVLQQREENMFGKTIWTDYILCTKTDTVSVDMHISEEIISNPALVYEYMQKCLVEGQFSVVAVTNKSIIETYNVNQQLNEQSR